MSRLKELRLHGFKSFADQTRFAFDPGVNAVIGPNGSGKSNMADAVRWVLGEQSNRSLRTRRADDVIFGGSDQRRPQGMAEAILTLDNADGWLPIDFAEVSIGRRAYRSGESEYLINGARARLRDVTELLGSGRLGANELVVVGQGTVDAALSLRPDERRQLFEEAAGVKGLQVKRNEASVRLARAADNLTRLNDLIGELKPQVRRLALQAEHQQQHDALGARARALVTISHERREQAARGALGEARRTAAAAAAALNAFREARAASRIEIAAAEEAYWAAEESARLAGTTRQEAREELIRLEARREGLAARDREMARAIEDDENELASARSMLATDVGGEPVDVVDRALLEAADAEAAWQAAVAALSAADDALQAAEQELAEARATHTDLIVRRARAAEELARHGARQAHVAAEHEAAVAALAHRRGALADATSARDDSERAMAEAASGLERIAAQREAVQEVADQARSAAIQLEQRLQALRAEAAALEEPHDGAARLSQRLAAAGWPPLLDSVHASKGSWPAIEAVVGGDLDTALLWADADPTAQMPEARGAVRLLPIASEPEAAHRAEAIAAVRGTRTLAEWIGMDRAPVALACTALAADLSALLTGWKHLPTGWAAVTREGDYADARGVVLRGRGEAPGGASARAHARRRELGSALNGLERDRAAAQEAAHAATSALSRAREAHLAARETFDATQRAARVAREAHAAVEAAVGREGERVDQLASELAGLASEAPHDADLTDSGGDGLVADRQAAADEARARRDEAAAHRDAARAAWTVARRGAEAVETRTAAARGQRATLEARATQLEAAIPDRRAAMRALSSEGQAVSQAVDVARNVSERAHDGFRHAEAARAERRAELIALERAATDAGAGDGASLEAEAQSAAIEASRRDEVLAGLLREREFTLDGLPAETGAEPMAEVAALDGAELDTELRRVRRTLSQIGNVNPFAVEEHRELSGRLDEMVGQDTDLRAAIASTEELIGTLDAEITAQFDAAFRAIGARFDEYCRLLFAGGSASLHVADEADGDAPTGIEITVRPPGKRLQRLAMLSGGERALTGVALLFAMLTVNPVPFCILDEVDAALDEANIGRFADALRKLSDSIDFVVITHNRATIEVADTIYGVTMTDAAVSRVLSLRLADLPDAVAVS